MFLIKRTKMTFDDIRREIKVYKQSEIVSYSISYLNLIQNTERKDIPFWNVLLLVKWAFLYTDNWFFRKKLNADLFNAVLHSMNQLESESKILDFTRGVKRGLR